MLVKDIQENYGTGWIKLYRSIKLHWIWQDDTYFKMWVDFLMRANHQDNEILIDSNLVLVVRGSFITSLKKLAKDYKCSVGRVRHFLKILETDSMIKQITTHKYTQISICNYEDYQNGQHTERFQNETGMKRERYGNDTNNNDKNVKNDKNEEEISTLTSYWNSALTTPKQLEIELIQELHTKHGFDKTKRIIRELAENGFKRVKTMREALNPDGSIKPKNSASENSYTPEQWKELVTKSETAQTRKELFNKYEFSESEKLWKKK